MVIQLPGPCLWAQPLHHSRRPVAIRQWDIKLLEELVVGIQERWLGASSSHCPNISSITNGSTKTRILHSKVMHVSVILHVACMRLNVVQDAVMARTAYPHEDLRSRAVLVAICTCEQPRTCKRNTYLQCLGVGVHGFSQETL